jgi:hypothetical protein
MCRFRFAEPALPGNKSRLALDLAAHGLADIDEGHAANNLAAPFVLIYESPITRDCE